MRVLIGCEFSGVVRDAFSSLGHDAWSCDLLPSETSGRHFQGDICEMLLQDWDLGIFHPPCTHIAASGARYFAAKRIDGRQQEGIDFFLMLTRTGIPKVAIENPVGIMSTLYRKPDQVIQPHQFGHGETKATCLWLFGLPKLIPTQEVPGREARIHRMPQSKNRWKERSRSYTGIAQAMADQWGR